MLLVLHNETPPATATTGSAKVETRLVFNSSSPVPSESLVLSAMADLLNSRLTNLTNSVTVLNYTYENISDTSYAISFIFNVSNISMPENPNLRNDTYDQVESIINDALNTLLNRPDADPFEPKNVNFTSSGDKIDGYMNYTFQESDTKQPASFLDKLKIINGTAVVETRLIFNSSSAISKESAVPKIIKLLVESDLNNLNKNLLFIVMEALLNYPLTSLHEPVKVVNCAYEVNITFSVSNISIPKNPNLRNDTYTHVQSLINNAVNALLNNSGADPIEPTSSNFTSSEDKVNGFMEYSLLNVINQPVNEISNTSYAVNITFSISNISIPKNPNLRNDTYTHVQSIINNAVTTLLNGTDAKTFAPNTSNFMSSETQVIGYMEYNFQYGALEKDSGPSVKDPLIINTVDTTGSAKTKLVTVYIYIRLVFENLINVPTEAVVLKATSEKLESKIRRERDTAIQKLDEPVSIQNITYTKMGSNSFTLDMAFRIRNVNASAQCDANFNNQTYGLIQKEINILMNTILTRPQSTHFIFPWANFTCNVTGQEIVANEVYVYRESDIQSPSNFLYEILKESGLVYYTVPPLVTIQPTTKPGNSTYTGAAWILGFVIPCGIVLILLPCWILLCCILCGCCAGIGRRWRRRRSYNVQYQTHSSLF
ncbi:hypothetical protein PDJAM_G00180720 [Pangasius djambal]|uniref:Uncharacterized protein n=1 Tax=Pangasius djambal TaxID=1691987 RepID=A0ACC5Y3D9_9TELE|nr:hypothetical protein [Pangasius djambal]